MAVIWHNTFNGPDGTAVTASNSADYGDPLAYVDGSVRYSTTWSATGAAALLFGSDDGTESGQADADAPTELTTWSIRSYVMVPAGSYQRCIPTGDGDAYQLDPEFDTWEIGGQDVSAYSAQLTGQTVRIEAATTDGTTTFRAWWTDPHSTGTPDWTYTAATAWGPLSSMTIVGNGAAPSYADELAIAEGEWIGPTIVEGTVEGTMALSGEVSGHKIAHGTVQGELAVVGELKGAPTDAAQGRLTLSGEVSGSKHTSGTVQGGLALEGTVEGYKIASGTVQGGLALEGTLVQLIVPVPALSVSVTPVGRLAATAVRK